MATTEFTLDDDNFDDAFFQEVDKLEELATCSTQPQHQQPDNQLLISKPYSFSSLPSHPPKHAQSSAVVDQFHTHSPPRQLSQRNPSNYTCSSITTRSVSSPFTDEQVEVQRLKSELSGVSKELLDLKQECSELKKLRHKEQQPSFVDSNKRPRTCNGKAYSRNEISPTNEYANAAADQAASWIGTEKKSTGIQTDKDDESLDPSTSGSTSTHSHLSELLSIWSPISGRTLRRNFVAKLLEACSSDFFILFGCLGSKLFTHASMPGNSLDLDSNEVANVSQLYSVFMKLTDDMFNINAFLKALLDACNIQNALVVHRSLHILHIALDHMLSSQRTCPVRDNVKVKRCYSGSDAVRILDHEVGRSGTVDDTSGDEGYHASFIMGSKNIRAAERENSSILCDVDWIHLFTSVCQIATKVTQEQARVEAVTIMNIILTRMDPYSDRGKFGGSLVFEAVTLLLRKEAGLFCRKETVRLLYLLLNCPCILATFCSSCKEVDSRRESPNDVANGLASRVSHAVLEGLARCVFCSEYVAKELSLRRNALVVLSFLASSGIHGLEIFLFHKLPKREATLTNLLGLVLQVLVSEIDAEELESCPAPESSKERTLLMREALKLLNRLVSHPAYSSMVLQVLTGCRDMVSLTIDIATKLSKKSRRLLKSDSSTRQMREYVADLACSFKKRVFTIGNE